MILVILLIALANCSPLVPTLEYLEMTCDITSIIAHYPNASELNFTDCDNIYSLEIFSYSFENLTKLTIVNGSSLSDGFTTNADDVFNNLTEITIFNSGNFSFISLGNITSSFNSLIKINISRIVSFALENIQDSFNSLKNFDVYNLHTIGGGNLNNSFNALSALVSTFNCITPRGNIRKSFMAMASAEIEVGAYLTNGTIDNSFLSLRSLIMTGSMTYIAYEISSSMNNVTYLSFGDLEFLAYVMLSSLNDLNNIDFTRSTSLRYICLMGFGYSMVNVVSLDISNKANFTFFAYYLFGYTLINLTSLTLVNLPSFQAFAKLGFGLTFIQINSFNIYGLPSFMSFTPGICVDIFLVPMAVLNLTAFGNLEFLCGHIISSFGEVERIIFPNSMRYISSNIEGSFNSLKEIDMGGMEFYGENLDGTFNSLTNVVAGPNLRYFSNGSIYNSFAGVTSMDLSLAKNFTYFSTTNTYLSFNYLQNLTFGNTSGMIAFSGGSLEYSFNNLTRVKIPSISRLGIVNISSSFNSLTDLAVASLVMLSDGRISNSFQSLTGFEVLNSTGFLRINDYDIDFSFNSLKLLNLSWTKDFVCLTSGSMIDAFRRVGVMNFANSGIYHILCSDVCGKPLKAGRNKFQTLDSYLPFEEAYILDFRNCLNFEGIGLNYTGPAEEILDAISLTQCRLIRTFSYGYGYNSSYSKSKTIDIPEPTTSAPRTPVTPAPTKAQESSNSLSTGSIILICVFSVVGLALVGVVFYYLFKSK